MGEGDVYKRQILLILVLTATMLTIWMYTSMINPIKKLQTAAQNIRCV